MNKYNWLIPLFIAAVCAVLAAFGIMKWNVAVWPITVLILTAGLTWILIRRRHKQ